MSTQTVVRSGARRFLLAAALCSSLLAPRPGAAEVPALAARALDPPAEAPVLDGWLDEAVWKAAPVAGGFTQREPKAGMPASEPTEVKVAYSPTTLYIGIRALDSEPRSVVARALERDADVTEDDSVSIVLDTFDDRRNAYFFATNANGVRTDGLISDEGDDFNLQWDGVWQVAARRTEEGWSAEMAIPFSTLRFAPGHGAWGMNVRRLVHHRAEEDVWSPLPVEADIMRVSLYGRLEGLEGLATGLNLRVKPFAVASGDGEATDQETGLDIKWGVSRALALDLTVNTDFAESEADEQEVNLSRFSLFRPEKREFFLENAGLFDFGPRTPFGPTLFRPFFSRRIGIAGDGEAVPIEWGARLTGRSGPWSVGLLGVRTGAAETEGNGDDWGVVRVRRRAGDRATVGFLSTRHGGDAGTNSLYGADADFQATSRLKVRGFLALSDDPRQGGDRAGGAGAVYRGPLWRWSLDALEIGERFKPDVGFLLRSGIRRYTGSLTFVPRPEIPKIRNLFFEGRGEVYTGLDGRVQSAYGGADLFSFRTKADDVVSVYTDATYERLSEPFTMRRGVVVPAGEYSFQDFGVWLETNASRAVSGSGWIQQGSFWDGERTAHGLALNLRPSRFFRTETTWDHHAVDLRGGSFTTDLFRQRINVPLTPDLSTSAFAQWNDAAELLSLNLRLRWIYRPGADVFLVLNQTWDAPGLGTRSLRDRQAVLKMTYLFSA
jgi:hypothetical protein